MFSFINLSIKLRTMISFLFVPPINISSCKFVNLRLIILIKNV